MVRPQGKQRRLGVALPSQAGSVPGRYRAFAVDSRKSANDGQSRTAMTYRILADLVLLIHALFIAFVVFGGLLALWKRCLIWAHLPALMWGALVITMGWICPLTPLENFLREMAGQESYRAGFIEHYLLLAIYPPGLTREMQIALAVLLSLGNLVVYALLYLRRPSRR